MDLQYYKSIAILQVRCIFSSGKNKMSAPPPVKLFKKNGTFSTTVRTFFKALFFR